MNDLRGLAALALLAAACGKSGDGGDQGAAAGPVAPPPTTVTADAAVVAAPAADAAVAAPAADAGAPATLAIGDCTIFTQVGTGAGPSRKMPPGLGAPGIRIPGDPNDPLGIGRPPPVARANLIDTVVAVGPGLDKEVVRRYLRRYKSRNLYCYEKAMLTVADLGAGTVQIGFTVTPSGQVVSPTATGMDKQLTDCLVQSLRMITLPQPTDGQTVPVKATFKFTPPADKPEVAADRPPRPRPDAGAMTAALRARADRLRACLPPGALGSATLQVALDRSGTAVNAKVDGMPDAAVATCLVAAVKGAVGKPGVPGALRCPLSFGGG